jgi:hypothetical protein
MPSVSLKQLLALLNTIVQWLAAIDERQVGCSQYRQQLQDSSYLNFLSIYPPEFTEMIDPLEANH